jgi:CPW-WPC domain-containing protein
MRLLCLHLVTLLAAGSSDVTQDLLQYSKISAQMALSISQQAELHAHRAFLAKKSKSGSKDGCPPCAGKAYAEACPAEWIETRSGTCIAPSSYAGSCARQQSFWSGSAVDKQEAERVCQICWRCPQEAGCVRDWNRPCPYGYSAAVAGQDAQGLTGESTCIADQTYEGTCEQRVEFASIEDKHVFAERCGVAWPCATRCEENLHSQCPEEWVHVGGEVCKAPASYRVAGCSGSQSFHGWTPRMKTEYAERCKVVWPCEREEMMDGAFEDALCSKLELEQCPQTWTMSQNGFCQPSPGSTSPCTIAVEVNTMNAEQKLAWAGGCLLAWPCKWEVEDGFSSVPRVAFGHE